LIKHYPAPAPIYFAARWHHGIADQPVVGYEELDDKRQETRKVHMP
jgi:hypothetical protein